MRDYSYLDAASLLELYLNSETEQFLCGDNSSYDSQWRLYGYDADGTRSVTTYEVTDETPPDRSIILRDSATDEEFVVSWSVSVSRRDVDTDSEEE